ncbi:MAG: hypothetical protein NTW21_39445 [Verrucomicrobia bacterium]|nr:hypothetical protein [Verrucomicrobiota bacterium]
MKTVGQTPSFSLDDEAEETSPAPAQVIDEEQLKLLWQKGREAWAEVASATEWVEHLRDS